MEGLPVFFPQSHSYDTSQAAEDAGHAVQVVDSAGILDAQFRGQDGLQMRQTQKAKQASYLKAGMCISFL